MGKWKKIPIVNNTFCCVIEESHFIKKNNGFTLTERKLQPMFCLDAIHYCLDLSSNLSFIEFSQLFLSTLSWGLISMSFAFGFGVFACYLFLSKKESLCLLLSVPFTCCINALRPSVVSNGFSGKLFASVY